MDRDHDFTIRFGPREGAGFPVFARSPAGEAASVFELPFGEEELGQVLASLEGAVRRAGGSDVRNVRVRRTAGPERDPVALGRDLFDRLFTEPLRSLWERSRDRTTPAGGRLRVQLQIDPGHPSLATLARLPWELMGWTDPAGFLALSDSMSLVRRASDVADFVRTPFSPPLRVLVLISNPNDLPPLDLEQEQRRVRETWAHCPGVAADFLDVATLPRLKEALAGAGYHVLHYMGHGDFDEATGEGVLLLEDEDGNRAPVNGATLGALMTDEPTLQLAFLNACNTAQSGPAGLHGAFGGVGAALVQSGVPAVLAMQFPVSDRAAIVFGERFYDMLTAEHPVDEAVAGGRRAVHEDTARSLEWATPVLWMRPPDGMLFDFQQVYGRPG